MPTKKQKLRQEIRCVCDAPLPERTKQEEILDAVQCTVWAGASVVSGGGYAAHATARSHMSRIPADHRMAAVAGPDGWHCPSAARPVRCSSILSSELGRAAAGRLRDPRSRPAGKSLCITERTLCIVPGLAFTRDGKRLGKGGGYYDRYLAAHPGLRTMGLTYRCLLQERIPCEAHDIGGRGHTE